MSELESLLQEREAMRHANRLFHRGRCECPTRPTAWGLPIREVEHILWTRWLTGQWLPPYNMKPISGRIARLRKEAER